MKDYELQPKDFIPGVGIVTFLKRRDEYVQKGGNIPQSDRFVQPVRGEHFPIPFHLLAYGIYHSLVLGLSLRMLKEGLENLL